MRRKERPQGYWDYDGYKHYCSVCGGDAHTNRQGKEVLEDRCRKCGAELTGDGT